MKKTISYLVLILFAFTFTFCNDDDDPKPDFPDEILDSHSFKAEAVASKGSSQTLPILMKLEDFSEIKDYINYIEYDSDIEVDSRFRIIGMAQNEGSKLENVVLRVKENPSVYYTIGDISADKEIKSVDYMKFNERLLTQLIKRKEITLNVEFSSSTGIQNPITFEQYLVVEFELD